MNLLVLMRVGFERGTNEVLTPVETIRTKWRPGLEIGRNKCSQPPRYARMVTRKIGLPIDVIEPVAFGDAGHL